MIGSKQLKQGLIIRFNNILHEVVDAQHHKPGKGGAFVKAKLRNLTSGSIISETLRPDDSFEQIYIEQKNMQYLYKDDMGYCFMDEESYEQIHIREEVVGSVVEYLKDNMTIAVNMHEGEILSIAPPIHVVLQVKSTEPGAKGNTVSGTTKPAIMETGKEIKVPLFVNEGDLIKIDTRTGTYIERA
ncbi:MAG: elongation factor P [Candidatus Omnitrophica bacterium]|nr:elongation factor P [Candidatus Omnitrophota bacterium]